MRPTVLFQVTDIKHRAYFKRYLAEGSWKNIPVQFVLPSNSHYINVPDWIRDQLVLYYMSRDTKLQNETTKIQTT